MIDDQPDGPDPLSGKDPHPREQIDLWPLHDARQELLEEIVSQAGESPARTKVLLSAVGIAAALALVVGGAWAVTNDGSDTNGNDEQVAAATSDAPAPTDVATDPAEPTTDATATETAEPTESTEEPRQKPDVRKRGLRDGNIRSLRECLAEIETLDGKADRVRLRKLSERRKGKWTFYIIRDGRRAIAIGDDCKWIRVHPEKPRQQG